MDGWNPEISTLIGLVCMVSLPSALIWGICFANNAADQDCNFCNRTVKWKKCHTIKHSFQQWHYGVRVVCKACVKKDMLVLKTKDGYAIFNDELEVVSVVSFKEFEGR